MFCKNCGKEIDDRAVICVNCGLPTDNFYNKAPAQESNVKYNAFAICGFTLSLVGIFFNVMAWWFLPLLLLIMGTVISILGLIFSILGFQQCNARKERCRGLAISGIAVSAASLALGLISIILYFS